MGYKVRWFGPKLRGRVDARVGQNLWKAAHHVANETKINLSTAYPPASSPGEFPHLRTGALRASIQPEVDFAQQTAIVGSDLEYSRYLETGTTKMDPRPFLTTTLEQERTTIRRILTS